MSLRERQRPDEEKVPNQAVAFHGLAKRFTREEILTKLKLLGHQSSPATLSRLANGTAEGLLHAAPPTGPGGIA